VTVETPYYESRSNKTVGFAIKFSYVYVIDL